MKRWRYVTVGLSFVVFIGALLRFAKVAVFAPSRGAFYCESAEWDFGNASADETVSHAFVIRNISGRVLENLTVKPACAACMKASCPLSTLRDGEATEIRVEARLKGRRGRALFRVAVRADEVAPLSLAIAGSVQGAEVANDAGEGGQSDAVGGRAQSGS